MYSFVRTCSDCIEAYRTWLCAVLVPRCDDIPSNQTSAAQTAFETAVNNEKNNPAGAQGQTVFSSAAIPSSVQTLLIRTDPIRSRTPFLGPAYLSNLTSTNATFAALNVTADNSPFPYAEVPPCSSVCTLVPASCPPFIQWSCPLDGVTLEAGYGLLQSLSISQVEGGDAGLQGGGWSRGSDRFGNVFCNSLHVDVLLAKRASAVRIDFIPKWTIIFISTAVAFILT